MKTFKIISFFSLLALALPGFSQTKTAEEQILEWLKAKKEASAGSASSSGVTTTGSATPVSVSGGTASASTLCKGKGWADSPYLPLDILLQLTDQEHKSNLFQTSWDKDPNSAWYLSLDFEVTMPKECLQYLEIDITPVDVKAGGDYFGIRAKVVGDPGTGADAGNTVLNFMKCYTGQDPYDKSSSSDREEYSRTWDPVNLNGIKGSDKPRRVAYVNPYKAEGEEDWLIEKDSAKCMALQKIWESDKSNDDAAKEEEARLTTYNTPDIRRRIRWEEKCKGAAKDIVNALGEVKTQLDDQDEVDNISKILLHNLMEKSLEELKGWRDEIRDASRRRNELEEMDLSEFMELLKTVNEGILDGKLAEIERLEGKDGRKQEITDIMAQLRRFFSNSTISSALLGHLKKSGQADAWELVSSMISKYKSTKDEFRFVKDNVRVSSRLRSAQRRSDREIRGFRKQKERIQRDFDEKYAATSGYDLTQSYRFKALAARTSQAKRRVWSLYQDDVEYAQRMCKRSWTGGYQNPRGCERAQRQVQYQERRAQIAERRLDQRSQALDAKAAMFERYEDVGRRNLAREEGFSSWEEFQIYEQGYYEDDLYLDYPGGGDFYDRYTYDRGYSMGHPLYESRNYDLSVRDPYFNNFTQGYNPYDGNYPVNPGMTDPRFMANPNHFQQPYNFGNRAPAYRGFR